MIDLLERYLMVFEYADGGSLRTFLSNTAVELDWPTKCKLGINIIDGLEHLHKLDIIHKNLVIFPTLYNATRYCYAEEINNVFIPFKDFYKRNDLWGRGQINRFWSI